MHRKIDTVSKRIVLLAEDFRYATTAGSCSAEQFISTPSNATMITTKTFSAVLLSLLLGGCANFSAVKQFGGETKTMAVAVGTEVSFASDQCARTLQMRRVVEGIDAEGQGCRQLKAATSELAKHTVIVIAAYGGKLETLADGTNFDYSAELGKTRTALIDLKNKDGSAAIDKNAVGAGIAIVDLLLKVATETQRRKAVERMVDEVENLQKAAGYLRHFFVEPTLATSPYGLVVRQNDGRLKDVQATLNAALPREPIRVREWQLDIENRRAESKNRVSGEVPGAMVALLDEWVKSLHAFKENAFKPNAKEWQSQIKALSDKVKTASDATDKL